MSEVQLERDEVAQSAYRAFCFASQEPEQAAQWEGLSLEAQRPWIMLAMRAESEFLRLEGSPYVEVGERLGQIMTGWGTMPSFGMARAWEAVARHLMILLDADEPMSLPELEESWQAWVALGLQVTPLLRSAV